jgi:O-acetyl-ADP-ribose deacetylase (regulator of RNase III)
VYGTDEPCRELLRNCYVNALRLAEEAGVASIAFPSISTGAFGYPMEEAARTAVGAIAQGAPELRSVRRVRFVLFDEKSLAVHDAALLHFCEDSRP